MIFLYYLGLFIFLASRMSHYVFGGDSGEFSLVARSMSVAHAPGYPFYSVLANLANRLVPFYTTPWRVALISALSTVAASFILYRLLVFLKVGRFSALLGATLYVFLFPVWQYSEIPEVFALSNLIVILVTYLLLRYKKTGHRSLLYGVALLLGLAVAHHHIFVLFVPAWLYLMYPERERLFKLPLKDKLLMVLLSVLGASFYLYPVIASGGNPPLDWENARTLDGLIRLFFRTTYGTFKAYTGSSGNVLNQLYDIFSFFVFILHDFRIIGIICIIVGFFSLARFNRRMFVFFSIAAGTHLFFFFYTNFTLVVAFTVAMYERFLIPVYLLLIVPFAFGLNELISVIKSLIFKYVLNKNLRRIVSGMISLFAVMYVLIIAFQNYRTVGKIRTLDMFAVFAKDLLATVPKGSIFFVGEDNSYFPTAYYRFGEGYRSDVRFVFVNRLDKKYYRERLKKQYPDLYIPDNYQVGAKDINSFLERNAKFGIYLDHPLTLKYTWEPYGLLWKFYTDDRSAASDSAKLLAENRRLWNRVYTIPKLDQNLRNILHLNVVQDYYMNAYIAYSRLLASMGNLEEAQKVVGSIVSVYQPDNDKMKVVYANLLVKQRKCANAEKYLKAHDLWKLSAQEEFLPSFISYYETCDSSDPVLVKLKARQKENNRSNQQKISDF